MTTKITGTLKRAYINLDAAAPRISGEIYGDANGRFRDGERIVTSTVKNYLGDGVYQTRNSVYRVEFASSRGDADILNDLAEFCHGKSIANKWWSEADRANPMLVPAKLALVHSEISEAMEGHRKSLMDDKLPHQRMIEVELADAVIRIADLAGFLELDLGGAVYEKMAFNDNRPDHKLDARQAAGGKAY